MKLAQLVFLLLIQNSAIALEPDWSKGAKIPELGRPNPYELQAQELTDTVRAGRLHALHYPVDVSGLMLPTKPMDRLLRSTTLSPWRSLEDLQAWLGMPEYPAQEGNGVFFVPFLTGKRPDYRMGFSSRMSSRGEKFTIGCAECHSENLFGRQVMGLTNRFPRANRLFVQALKVFPNLSPAFFQSLSGATNGETAIYSEARRALSRVVAREPVQLGLDTSLAQVALSLAKQTGIPADSSADMVSDSKPAVWWNTKYKNRWLSDGSVVSGNPILTNFLWNEIGRGTDITKLSQWIQSESQTIRELTTAVFSTAAPRFTDFFPPVDETEARKGESLFIAHCSGCHGVYEKGWSQLGSEKWTQDERQKTVRVHYPQATPVINVGTDPGRYRGMRALEALNNLPISKANGILIQRQYGYVPPPLEGIWARWPYFHNNSAPSLCAVLTKGSDRPTRYLARPAEDKSRDFDSNCNGYPAGSTNWSSEYVYEAGADGRKNTGHDEGIFLKKGVEIFKPAEKISLIRFLQTL